MNIKGLWKVLLIIILVQIINSKNYIRKHKNGKHFLISTKHKKKAHDTSKLDLHKKKISRSFNTGNGFTKQTRKQRLSNTDKLKEALTPGHDFQIELPMGGITSANSPIRSTGKCIIP